MLNELSLHDTSITKVGLEILNFNNYGTYEIKEIHNYVIDLNKW
jgi:hypothetical protein